MWTCAKEWVEQSHAWHELPLPQVDAEAAASKAGEFGSQLARVSKVLEKKGESRENAARCCKLLLQETKSFEDDEAPLMLLVCEPGMKQRHWDEIKATTKLEFSVTAGMNMMQLMDIGLNHYVHLIEGTDSAQKMNLNLTWSRRWRLHETATPSTWPSERLRAS